MHAVFHFSVDDDIQVPSAVSLSTHHGHLSPLSVWTRLLSHLLLT